VVVVVVVVEVFRRPTGRAGGQFGGPDHSRADGVPYRESAGATTPPAECQAAVALQVGEEPRDATHGRSPRHPAPAWATEESSRLRPNHRDHCPAPQGRESGANGPGPRHPSNRSGDRERVDPPTRRSLDWASPAGRPPPGRVGSDSRPRFTDRGLRAPRTPRRMVPAEGLQRALGRGGGCPEGRGPSGRMDRSSRSICLKNLSDGLASPGAIVRMN